MHPKIRSVACATIVLVGALSALASPPKNLAPTPPMGWNSWDWFGKADINETIIRESIDAMVEHGLRDAGYNYVVVDGGWRDTKLGPKGELLPHPVKFPNGIKALADYAHSRGLKFGVHTVPGTHDCGGDAVGAFGREEVHVKQLVDWGVDFVKLDKCKFETGWTEEALRGVYTKWRDLLAAADRDIVYSISAYEYRDWNPDVCHMSRTTGDIKARINKGGAVFEREKPGKRGPYSVMEIADINDKAAAFAGRGYWNDPDMLVLGEQGLSVDEQKAHFALWCVMSAPLILGNDVRNMTPAEKEMILNRECIAVNQDPTEQGRRIRKDGTMEIWAKRLTGNRTAVLLLNRDQKATQTITFNAKDIGITGTFKARDVFARADLGRFDGPLSRSTSPHAVWFLLISDGK